MPKSDWYTYRELRDALNELSEEQLDMTVSIYDPEIAEVYPVSECFVVDNLPPEHQQHFDEEEFEQPLLLIGTAEGIDA